MKSVEHDPGPAIDRLVDAMRTNDPEAAAAVYAEDVVIVDPLYDVVGRDAAVEAFRAWFDAFRILALEVREAIVQGSQIAVRWEWTAIHQGDYLGVPATGKEFATWDVILFDARDGYVSRDLSTWDCTQLRKLEALQDQP